MEIVTNHADVTVRHIVQPLLGSREELIWVGQPWQGVRFRREDIWRIPQSLIQALLLVFFGVSFFHAATWWGILAGIALWTLAFYGVIGRFFADAYWRSRTYYALTQRRIIIHSTALRTSTTSYDLRGLYQLRADVNRDGRGTILMGKERDIFEMFFNPQPFLGIGDYKNSLEKIPNAQQVYELIQDVRG